MRRLALALVAAGGLATGTAAAAQDYGYGPLAAGRLDVAEAKLDAARQADPAEPAVLINLASIYARTGREGAARGLYEQVLANPNVLLELGNRDPAWSHTLARRGMRRPAVLAAR